MGKRPGPRSGSMQFWPRKRASRQYSLVRSWAQVKEVVPLGFAGYKVGMTNIGYVDNVKTSISKGMEVSVPVTIVECPPMKIFGARAYKKEAYATKIVAETLSTTVDKELANRTNAKATGKETIAKLVSVDAKNIDHVMLICYTQPKATGFGKKTPELFEVGIGGTPAEQLKFAIDKIGKEFTVSDVFTSGAFSDIHAVTTGRGTQGAVKRFGVSIRHHKSEKTKRGVGSTAGGWSAQQHTMYRVPKAGQMGYHNRTEYNKQILSIDNDFSKVNPKGGFVRYGEVKNTYILVRGSVAGPEKRMVKLTRPVRYKGSKLEAPKIEYISIESKQS